MDPDTITSTLGMLPKFEWRVGDPRRASAHRPVGDVCQESYWCGPSSKGEDEELSATLREQLDYFETKKDFFDSLVASGGEAEFFVGWFMGSQPGGTTLGSDLLRRMAALHIALSLDVYG